MAVDSGFAAVLRSDALYLGLATASGPAWAGRGVEVKGITPFATRAAAEPEAYRLADFLYGPTVRDQVVVAGQRRDLVGRARRVRIQTGDLGYGEPLPVFVIGAEERETDTVLTVLRRL